VARPKTTPKAMGMLWLHPLPLFIFLFFILYLKLSEGYFCHMGVHCKFLVIWGDMTNWMLV
jgi:hypothetical protein